MTRKNQKALASAAAKREAQRARENATPETTTEPTQANEPTTAAEPEYGPLTAEAAAAIERIERIEAAQKTLRDYGLFYTITSDRTADREPCLCGCGQFPAGKKSVFCPGHDAKAKAATTPRGPKFCSCQCGGETKGGNWLPGHDAKFHAAQRKAAKMLETMATA